MLKNLLSQIYHRLALRMKGFPRYYNDRHGPEGHIHETVEFNDSKISGYVKIGERSRVRHQVSISAHKLVKIGRFTSIQGPGTSINSGVHGVQIGSFCSIAKGVDLQEYNHFTKRPSSYYIFQNIFKMKDKDTTSKGPIIIHNDVWIGAQSVILSGVEIGNGAIVAANSVVHSNVAPYAIVGGTPAKVISMRFSDDLIEKLQELEWWEWDESKILRNKTFFEEELTLSSFDKLI